MDQVLQYKIPVWHPLLVHFPIALVLVAAIVILVWLIRDRVSILVTGAWIQLAAVITTASAYFTGESMEERSEGVPIVDTLVGLHEDAALLSIWMVCLALLAILLAFISQNWRGSDAESSSSAAMASPFWIRMIVFILVFAALAAVWWTAHIGGTMVWGIAK